MKVGVLRLTAFVRAREWLADYASRCFAASALRSALRLTLTIGDATGLRESVA